ncbi:MAG: two-component sensor histidine kinase, partial [Chroococcidiopsidaceae cyanobacterium CP_BM_RX_35]|nr:two-component sensor histidine kinase [Chroococcidiopsidaceae cyanobacterium CP_BM_RX_35]
MKFPSSFFKAIDQAWRKLDPFSLRVRLTVGIAAVSAAGLGSVAIWTSWQMQQILIESHKQSIEYIAYRLPRDVELYREIWPVEIGLKKAIDNLTTAQTLLWVKRPNGTIAAESAALKIPADPTAAALMSFTQMRLRPQLYEVNGRYFVLCGNQLQLKGKALGHLFVAQDISLDQTLFLAVVWSLGIASVLSILAITVVIAVYIQRSLRPLRQLSQLAETISAEDLGEAQLRLEHAPTEVKELAQMWDIMLSRLSASWEQQRQFTSNVSHELRTPLTIVHGYLQSMLRRGTNLTEPQREALEIAASEAERTIRLLQDLLDLARADSDFHIESLVLNDVVAEVVGMAEQFSQRVIFIKATAPIIVRAARDHLKQVLLNLIDNALKYSNKSESVILKLSQLGEQALIQVCDKGCGIPLQHQAR